MTQSSFTPGDIAQREHDQDRVARRVTSGDLFDLKAENNGNGDPVYLGLAVPGSDPSSAVWQIRKLSYDGSGNLTSVDYADGVSTFTKKWDDRATYSY